MGNPVVEAERRRQLARLAEIEAELAKMNAERGHIAYTLTALDRMDQESADSSSVSKERQTQPSPREISGAARRRRTRTNPPPGSTLGRALKVINGSDRGWKPEEVVSAMRQEGWEAEVKNELETVRTALARAVSDGLIERRDFGVYGRLPQEPGESDQSAEMESEHAADDAEGDDTDDPEQPSFHRTRFRSVNRAPNPLGISERSAAL